MSGSMDGGNRAPSPFDPARFDDSAWGPEWSPGRRRGREAELREWLDLALDCCDAAYEIARLHFRHDLEISTKSDRTLVTQADRLIETLIRERILSAHPGHGLVGEEYGTEGHGSSVRWYVDPIDGTHNFVRGIPLFATLLGVERDGELQVGVLSAPALGERWFAWRGGGAWASRRPGDTRRLGVSRVAVTAEAQILYDSPLDVERSGWAPGFTGLLGSVWRDRGFGDFWGYALLADGAAEAMIEVGIHPWDLAAPLVLVEEAGGRMTDFGGRRAVDIATVVASNGRLHRAVLAALALPGGEKRPEHT
ncbi:MAG: inositol monophosphatase family protein [Candidatus Limnocylindrales bacterium]